MVCPALRRVENGLVCTYVNRIVDPLEFGCAENYTSCPVYNRQKAESQEEPIVLPLSAVEKAAESAQSAMTADDLEKLVEEAEEELGMVSDAMHEYEKTAEEEKEEVQRIAVEEGASAVQESKAQEAEKETSADFEEALAPVMDDIVLKYYDLLEVLNESWRSYEAAVLNYRRQWEVEKLKLRRSLDLLSSTISNYERALNELDLKKDLMPEDQYDKARREIEERLNKARSLLDEMSKRYNEIEDAINQHFKRVLDTSTNADVINLRISLSRLDELLKEGKISREAYERLKKELEVVISS